MADGPIHRSPADVAEAIAQHRIGAGGQILDPYSIAARIGKEAQNRIDLIIRRESELGAFDLEAVKELGEHTI